MTSRIFTAADVLGPDLKLDDDKASDIIASKFSSLIDRGYEFAILRSDFIDEEEGE